MDFRFILNKITYIEAKRLLHFDEHPKKNKKNNTLLMCDSVILKVNTNIFKYYINKLFLLK